MAAVMAYEKVTLYGVPIIDRRKVNFGRIDPAASRELFIRNALVEGDWRTHHQFFHDNRKLLGEVEELEHRARRRDILVDDETLFDFYDERVPDDVVSGAHFDSWWKGKRLEDPELLDFERSMLINEKAGSVTKDDYPDSWRQGALKFRVTYQFEPGADADGVTVHVPLQVLNQVTSDGFDWQIPGLREEMVVELIRSLPKPIRRHYVPAPNYAKAFLEQTTPPDGPGPRRPDGEPAQEPLPVTLARELRRMVGVPMAADDFDLARVPDHLKITFRIVDERRRTIAEDKDLEALRLRLRPKARQALSKAAAATAERTGGETIERTGLTDWTIGTLVRVFETRRAGQPVKAYPALVDQGASVAVRLFDTEEEQRQAMWAGTRRLILLNIPVNPAKFASDKLTNQQKLALSGNPHGSIQALFDDCATAAADKLMTDHGAPAWDEESFRKLYDKVRADLVDATVRTVGQVQQVLAAWQACERRLKATNSLVLINNVQDVKDQLAALVPAGFVTRTGVRRLPDLMRYLVAVDRRLQQMPTNVQRDTTRMEKVHEMQDEYAWLLEQLPKGRPVPPEVLGHPLDDRGAPGELLRARAGHGAARIRQAHRQGDRRGGAVTPRPPPRVPSRPVTARRSGRTVAPGRWPVERAHPTTAAPAVRTAPRRGRPDHGVGSPPRRAPLPSDHATARPASPSAQASPRASTQPCPRSARGTDAPERSGRRPHGHRDAGSIVRGRCQSRWCGRPRGAAGRRSPVHRRLDGSSDHERQPVRPHPLSCCRV